MSRMLFKRSGIIYFNISKFKIEFSPTGGGLMPTVKRNSKKNKIKSKKIQELCSSFDAGPSWHLSQVILVIIRS